MPRALLFLALLLAGVGGETRAQAPAASRETGITTAGPYHSLAVLRASGMAVQGTPQGIAGPPDRGSASPRRNPSAAGYHLDARCTALAARAGEYAEYGTTLALARAGRASCHTTAPPPFEPV